MMILQVLAFCISLQIGSGFLWCDTSTKSSWSGKSKTTSSSRRLMHQHGQGSFSFSDQSRKHVYSPVLIRSELTSKMILKYTVTSTSNTATMATLFYRQYCVSTSGRRRVAEWQSHVLDSSHSGYEKTSCIELFDYRNPTTSKLCRLFRVELQVTVAGSPGTVTVRKVDFGNFESCLGSYDPRFYSKTNASCNFDEGDCGFRNDACGLQRWKVSKVPASGNPVDLGTPLLIEEKHRQCNYSICIPCMQSSGFTEFNETTPPPPPPPAKRAVAPPLGSALTLNPRNSSEVAVGVFGTPTLIHHPNNKILSFGYDFQAYGLHQIVVGALCESLTARPYVLLKSEYQNYDVRNFEVSPYRYSGTKCIHLHKFITESFCSRFSVQFQGGAFSSPLAIDNIGFHAETKYMPCDFIDN